MYVSTWASLLAQKVKNPPAVQEIWVQSLGWEDFLEESMVTHSRYSCLENPHGQRRLAGYSPWGHKEPDTTEHSAQHSACVYIYIHNLLKVKDDVLFFPYGVQKMHA